MAGNDDTSGVFPTSRLGQRVGHVRAIQLGVAAPHLGCHDPVPIQLFGRTTHETVADVHMDNEQVGIALHRESGRPPDHALPHGEPDTPASTTGRGASDPTPWRASTAGATSSTVPLIQALPSSLRAARLADRK